jgi:hypothetical protein
LSGKRSRLTVQDFQVACRAAPVSDVRQPGRVFGGDCQLLLLAPDLLALPLRNERVGDVAKSLLHRPLVDERRFLSAGFRDPDTVANPAALENRLKRARAERPEAGRA